MSDDSAGGLLKQLRAALESPMSTKGELLRIVEKLEKVPPYRGTVKNDPLREAIVEVFSVCTLDADRVTYFHGEPVTAAILCDAAGRKRDVTTLTRIGKIVGSMGYTRLQRTRLRGSVYRAPDMKR